MECPTYGYAFTGADALDRCADGDIQLVGGRGDFEGRVEICFGGTWGTVCEHGFTRRFTYSEAGVICRQLGYNFTGADHFLGGFFTPGTGPIFIDELECTGDEERLISCRYNPIGVHNCEHSDDAGVKCPTILGENIMFVSRLECGSILKWSLIN